MAATIIGTLLATAAALAAPARAEPKFFFGSATAAYQIEGHRAADGRTPSIWDAFDTKGRSEIVPAAKPFGQPNVHESENGDVADGDYTAFGDTTKLLQRYGFDAYRMSLSWTRILSYSNEGCTGPEKKETCQLGQPTINEAGLEHYKTVLRGLKEAGLLTAVTLWHWDTPLAVEEWAATTQCAETNEFTETQTGSAWLCPEIADIFSHYTQIATEALDEYVDHWITLNEPLTVTGVGYAPPAKHAPGRCSDRDLCWYGNETVSWDSAAALPLLVFTPAQCLHADRALLRREEYDAGARQGFPRLRRHEADGLCGQRRLVRADLDLRRRPAGRSERHGVGGRTVLGSADHGRLGAGDRRGCAASSSSHAV